MCVPGDQGGQKRELDPQELELQMPVSHRLVLGIHLCGIADGILGSVHTKKHSEPQPQSNKTFFPSVVSGFWVGMSEALRGCLLS